MIDKKLWLKAVNAWYCWSKCTSASQDVCYRCIVGSFMAQSCNSPSNIVYVAGLTVWAEPPRINGCSSLLSKLSEHSPPHPRFFLLIRQSRQ